MNKITKIIIGIVVLILVVWGISSLIGKQNTPVQSGEPIRIGIATILNGDFSAAGENMANAAKLAVEKINKEGGVNGQAIDLYIENSGWTSKDGLSAVQKLANIDGVHYIVGGMSSNGTVASANLANENKVLIMTPVTGGSNVDNAGEYIFRNGNSDVLAGRDLADAMIKLGYKNVGVIAETTEYTLDIKNTFENRVAELGGTIVVSEEFQSDIKDYRTLISKIRETNPEALLVLSQLGTNAAQFIKQSRELGFNPPLFTDFTFATNQTAKEIVGSFDGIYFADPAYDANNSKTKAFFKLYEETYGIPSLIPFHALATYDAVMMYAEAIKAVGDNPEAVKDWLLKNVKNRRGLMGVFSFDDKGNSDLGFEIKIIKNGVPEAIDF